MMTSTKTYTPAVLALVVGMFLTATAMASSASMLGEQPAGFTWTLTLPNGQWIQHTTLGNEPLIVRNADEGFSWAIHSSWDEVSGEVQIQLFGLSEDGRALLQRELSSVRVVPGAAGHIYLKGSIDLRFEVETTISRKVGCLSSAEERVQEVSSNDQSLGDPIAPSPGCCVTCGGTTACGCGVSMSCGSCCMPSCCPYLY